MKKMYETLEEIKSRIFWLDCMMTIKIPIKCTIRRKSQGTSTWSSSPSEFLPSSKQKNLTVK